MIGVLEIVRTTLAVEEPMFSVSFTAGRLLNDIYIGHPSPWEEPILRKLHFIDSADLIECLTILAEGK